MKKTLTICVVCASFASAAHAQSSVTLYGVIDAGLSYTSNVEHRTQFAAGSGDAEQSRWGLRGTEDLGGGLKTIFTLESGFNVNNGTTANNGGLFNRQAFVGLLSDYGTVTLGRQYDATQDYLAPLTATGSWGGTYFAQPYNNNNLSTNGGFSVNNSVKFTSANYAGFSFGGTYGFSNQARGAVQNMQYSLGAGYHNGGLSLAAAYAQQNNPGVTTGATEGSTVTGVNMNLASGRKRVFGVAGAYSFGPADVGFAWTESRLQHVGLTGLAQHADNFEVNAKYNLTAALGLGAAYNFTSARSYYGGSGLNQRYHQLGLQADYAMSRRTDLYAEAVYQHASGRGNVASIYSGDLEQDPSSSRNQTVLAVGLRHRF